MKILHVLPVISRGGAERIIIELLNRAAADGHETELLVACRSRHELGYADKISSQVRIRSMFGDRSVPINGPAGKVLRLLQYPLVPGWILLHLRYVLSFEIIDCHLPLASLFASCTWLIKRLLKRTTPVVIETFHADWEWTSPMRRRFFWTLWRQRDGIILEADSPPTVQEVETGYPYINARLIKVGASRPLVEEKDAATRQHFLSQLGIDDPRAIIVGTISRMNSERQAERYIGFFDGIAKALGTNCHFIWAGDGPLRSKIEHQVKQAGLTNRVHFLGFTSDVALPLSVIQLYLTSTSGSACGIAGLEAMLCGIPVFGIQCSHSEYDDHWIYSSVSPEEMSTKINELLTTPGALAGYTQLQNERAKSDFSSESMWKQTQSFFSDMLARKI